MTLTSIALIAVVWVSGTEAEIRKTCFEITGKHAIACSVITETQCTVYSPRIRNELDDKNFTRLGEEVAHCFHGDFHKHPELLERQH